MVYITRFLRTIFGRNTLESVICLVTSDCIYRQSYIRPTGIL